MKTLLIFPPFANPTYIPYPLMDFVGYIKSHSPSAHIDIWDLNIDVFNRETVDLAPLINLVCDEGSFLHEDTYYPSVFKLLEKWWRIQETFNRNLETYIADHTETTWLSDYLTPERITPYDAVALSLSYHQKEGSTQFFCVMAIATYIRQYFPDKKIVVGGPLTTHWDPIQLMTNCPAIDALFCKESEESFRLWLKTGVFDEIPNIVYRQKDKIINTGLADNVIRTTAYLPDISPIRLDQYLSPSPVITLQYKRGCGWNKCTFCSQNLSYFGYEPDKNVESFLDKVECLYRHGVRYFYFSDQMLYPSDLVKISAGIKNRSLSIFWAIMAMPQKGFSEEIMEAVYHAGCRWITWGIESGSPDVLKRMNKPIDLDVVKENLVASHLAGIQNVALMMYGFPGETQSDFEMSLAFLEEVRPYYYDHSMSPFHLCKGSPLFKNPEKFGVKIGAPVSVTDKTSIQLDSHLYHHHSDTPEPIYANLIPEPKSTIPFAEHMVIYAAHKSHLIEQTSE